VGDNFTEHYFKGALHNQLRDALRFIKTNIIHEHVIKIANQAEALRFYNYPYEAVEEALSNAVYHKGYDLGKPIEVQIFPNMITVLSYPGPIPPVNAQIVHNQKIVARDYRNRRIGDFLKELDLTEGRGTGFPKMRREMVKNGSPEPIIETNMDGNYFLVTLLINPEYVKYADDQANDIIDEVNNGVNNEVSNGVNNEVNNEVSNGVNNGVSNGVTNQTNNKVINSLEDIIEFSNGVNTIEFSNGVNRRVINKVNRIIQRKIHDKVEDILRILLVPTKRSDLFKSLSLSNQSNNRTKYLDPLINIGWIAKKFPDKMNNPAQRYFTTESGKRVLALIQTFPKNKSKSTVK
jgi:ATP-dependent DNA helicase RecG